MDLMEAGSSAGESRWVLNVTTQSFEQDVIERSMQTLVLIDFWAPWCAPCRQLTPILQKLANEFAGQFVLAKVNTEEEPQIAGAFGVQSIPWVVAFLNGQPVDQFLGVMPEAEIRAWLTRLLPSPAEILATEAAELEATAPQQAEAKYREALALDAGNELILTRLAGLLWRLGRTDETQRLIERLEAQGDLNAEAAAIKSEMELRAAAAETGGVEEARKTAAAHPDDLGLQIQLADALGAAQQYREALEVCLAVVSKDRTGAGQQARETMVKLFQVLGPASELTSEYRRKLATALY